MIIKFTYRKSVLSSAIGFVTTGEVIPTHSVEFDVKDLTFFQRSMLLPFVDIKYGTNAYFYCDNKQFPEFNSEPSFEECMQMLVEWYKSSGQVPKFINKLDSEKYAIFWEIYEKFPLTAFIFCN